jgi:hypothetical protein
MSETVIILPIIIFLEPIVNVVGIFIVTVWLKDGVVKACGTRAGGLLFFWRVKCSRRSVKGSS